MGLSVFFFLCSITVGIIFTTKLRKKLRELNEKDRLIYLRLEYEEILSKDTKLSK